METKIVRLNNLVKILGMSRATIWRRIKSDQSFPQVVRLGEGKTGCVGFLSVEVEQWLQKIVEQRDNQKKKGR